MSLEGDMLTTMMCLLFVIALEQALGGNVQAPDSELKEIETLVVQLNSDKAADREKASGRLYTIGKPALDSLRRAASGQDAELRRRASRLVKDIEYRITRKIFVSTAQFSGDGNRVVLGSSEMDDAIIWVRDVDLGKDILFLRGHPDRIGKIALSTDGCRLLIPGFQTEGTSDFSVQLWDLRQGCLLKRIQGHTGPVYSAVFSPDGKQVLTCSADKTVRLWDLDTGKEIRRFRGHGNNVFRAVFSPDGARVLSCGMDGTARLWNVDSAKELHRFDLGDFVNAIAVSPDGKRALSTTGVHALDSKTEVMTVRGLTMKLLDLENGKELRSFVGHEDLIMTVAYSPDGRKGLSCAWDQTVRLWDIENGKELACFRAKEKRVMSATFVKNGTRILSVCADGSIDSWDVPAK